MTDSHTISDDDVHGTEDATLGGYMEMHDRPPAFEGSDGHPYTVSLEIEKGPDLTNPYAGFLVFPRWATTGLGIIGHAESPILKRGRGREEVLSLLREITLLEVRQILDAAVAGTA